MGFDLLEIGFRIEERFGIELTDDDWSSATSTRNQFDMTAGELLGLVCSKFPKKTCPTCRYDLRGHDAVGICPECGASFDVSAPDVDATWRSLRQIVSEMLHVDVEAISKDSLLIEDLGMTGQ